MISDSVIARRLLAAGGEIAHAPECEYVSINQQFSIALNELTQIVNAARLLSPLKQSARLAVFPIGYLGAPTELPRAQPRSFSSVCRILGDPLWPALPLKIVDLHSESFHADPGRHLSRPRTGAGPRPAAR